MFSRGQWTAVSGKVRLSLPGALPAGRPGDYLEVVGQLSAPAGSANPGEFDHQSHLRDQGIRALVVVSNTADAVVVQNANAWVPATGIDALRHWGEQVIGEFFPPGRRELALALLLGQQEAMEQYQWDRYQRTGVGHVLAVSGQHLIVLAGFLAVVLRLLQLGRRPAAAVICVLLLGYSLLTGWRVPVRRALFMVGALYGSLWLQRVPLAANSFALAWLLVCALDPASIFATGCQLSFLASGMLLWAMGLVPSRPHDPLDELLDEQRPLWLRAVRDLARAVGALFVLNAIVWLAVTPLIAAHFHLVCPAGVLLGVPVLLLTSCALIAGFLMLAFALVLWPVAAFFAWLTNLCLWCCDALAMAAERIPGAYWHIPDVPAWWLCGFYGALIAGTVLPELRRRGVWVVGALLLWLCLGLTLPLVQSAPKDFRCTFLAVGHGSCVVMELPDGRTLLYDAGALNGPEVTRRTIAPFLWSRGVTRIDEVFLSHADLDHFNGLPSLLERFAVGQISCTPTFAGRDMAGVQLTMQAVADWEIPVRIIKAGDRLSSGAVDIQVVHPPPVGPEGRENFRSLVLLVRHLDHTVLLTGDLEGPGLGRVLSSAPIRVDVLMAPHHGSVSAEPKALAMWSAPKVVVASQGEPRNPLLQAKAYQETGATYLSTWQEGAVVVTSSLDGLSVATFKTKQRWKIR
jgi:competence protein ComEC